MYDTMHILLYHSIGIYHLSIYILLFPVESHVLKLIETVVNH